MKNTPTGTRQKIALWDEIKDLHERLLHWYYGKHDRTRALKYCHRLKELLEEASPDHQAALGEECWSLIWELKGNLDEAIRYRKRGIKIIKALRRKVRPGLKWLSEVYKPIDLADRLDLLAILHFEAGQLNKAIQVLRASKKLCQAHRVPFGGAEMLHDYLIKQGLLLHDRFRYRQALHFFQEAFRVAPQCPAAIYNVANTLHMLRRNREAHLLLSTLIRRSHAALAAGCSLNPQPGTFKNDALYLMFLVVLEQKRTWSEAFPYATKHLRSRRRGLTSIWPLRRIRRDIRALREACSDEMAIRAWFDS